jgi:hypothetical protein
MKITEEKPLNVTIKYNDDPANWNNFLNLIISFIVDNNISGEKIKNENSI